MCKVVDSIIAAYMYNMRNAWEDRVLVNSYPSFNTPRVRVRDNVGTRVRGADPAGTGSVGLEERPSRGVLNNDDIQGARGPSTQYT